MKFLLNNVPQNPIGVSHLVLWRTLNDFQFPLTFQYLIENLDVFIIDLDIQFFQIVRQSQP